MKNYKSLIAGSLMAAVIMSAPAITFASDKDIKNNRENKSGIEKNINKFSDKKDNSNSIWNRISKYREDHEEDEDSIINKVPTISDLKVAKIKSHKAFIYWNTDIKADSAIWYSKTSNIDTSVKSNYSRKSEVLKHKIVLKNLEENTKYYVIIKSTNDEGTITSSEISFTTSLKNYESVKPVITELTGLTTIAVGENETVTVKAYDPKNSELSYAVNWGDTKITSGDAVIAQPEPVFIKTATFTHIYEVPGTYVAKFIVKNTEGKETSSLLKITVNPVVIVDVTAPVISGVTKTISATNTTISWVTNEPSTSSIFYSTGISVDINNTATASITDDKLVKEHSISIPGLVSSTIYHFILKSADALKNAVVSSEFTFYN